MLRETVLRKSAHRMYRKRALRKIMFSKHVQGVFREGAQRQHSEKLSRKGRSIAGRREFITALKLTGVGKAEAEESGHKQTEGAAGTLKTEEAFTKEEIKNPEATRG